MDIHTYIRKKVTPKDPLCINARDLKKSFRMYGTLCRLMGLLILDFESHSIEDDSFKRRDYFSNMHIFGRFKF